MKEPPRLREQAGGLTDYQGVDVPNPTERFWPKVEKTGTCWLWTGSVQNERERGDRNGHGLFWVSGRLVKAHRFAYELLVGPIPPDRVIDHICEARNCVNPEHLRVVTIAQNNQNKRNAFNASTGVRGVTLYRGRYKVQAQVNGIKYHGGSFGTIPEAEQAAIALRNRLMTHNIEK